MTTNIIPFIEQQPACSFCKAVINKGELALINPTKTRYMCMHCIKLAAKRLREDEEASLLNSK